MANNLTYIKFITRDMLRSQTDTLFVFGDNMARVGLGGQAREMRGEPNAVGIPTKWSPGNLEKDFFSDEDYDQICKELTKDLHKLMAHALRHGKIVWPADDIGTGLAELPTRAPKIWAFLQERKKNIEKVANR